MTDTATATKHCTKCGAEKILAEFHREKARHDGLRPQCKACTRAQNNSRAASTRERKAEYDRARRGRLGGELLGEKRAYYHRNRDAIRARHNARRSARPERVIWMGMRSRCTNPQNKAFASYGGRGITICARWLASFEDFLADMGPRPSAGHSIDRIDNDGNYEPGNCRWASVVEQARNKRTSRRVTIDGETKTVAEWAQWFGVPAHPVYDRLDSGLSPLEAFGVST